MYAVMGVNTKGTNWCTLHRKNVERTQTGEVSKGMLAAHCSQFIPEKVSMTVGSELNPQKNKSLKAISS